LRQFRTRALVGAACTILAAPAHAALGGAYDTVLADRAHLAAKLTSSSAATHTVHALTMTNGVAREFARPDGGVFAITWRGPGRPDLRQLLGPYFDTFQADNAPRGGRRSRRPLSVNRSDIVVQTGGHPGAFWGVAYLPKMTPAGFAARDLQ